MVKEKRIRTTKVSENKEEQEQDINTETKFNSDSFNHESVKPYWWDKEIEKLIITKREKHNKYLNIRTDQSKN